MPAPEGGRNEGFSQNGGLPHFVGDLPRCRPGRGSCHRLQQGAELDDRRDPKQVPGEGTSGLRRAERGELSGQHHGKTRSTGRTSGADGSIGAKPGSKCSRDVHAPGKVRRGYASDSRRMANPSQRSSPRIRRGPRVHRLRQ